MKAFHLEAALRRPEEVTALYLHNCGLTAVPEVVFRCPKLKILEISANPLQELPAELGDLTGLEELILENNQITTLPLSLGRLQSLQQLVLSGNPLEAAPSFLGELTKLRRLGLARLGLRSIPAGIDQLIALEELDLSDNRLLRLPDALGILRPLRRLDLSGNRLRRLPATLAALSNLEQVDLSHNRLTTLPTDLPGGWPCLQQLLLSRNALDALPASIGDCGELRRLQLARNRLDALTHRIGELRWLTELDLSRNRLATLPDSIGGCRRLQRLDLSHNILANLPATIGELPRLDTLHLDHNELIGLPPLPPSLRRLTAAQNKLSGFPDHLASLRRLTELTLTGNPISAEPPDLLHLDDLRRYRPPAAGPHQGQQLTAFLRACRKDQTPEELRPALYQVYRGEPAALAALSLPHLFRGLHFGIRPVALAIRTHLTTERGRPLRDHPLGPGAVLVLLGQTPFRRERLAQRLAPLHIRLAPALDATTTHVLADLKPRDYAVEFLGEHLVFISPADVNALLDREQGKAPAKTIDARQLERLRRLLLHDDTVNVRLAAQWMYSRGVPAGLLTDLFVAWKRSPRGALKNDLRRLLERHLPETDRRLLSWRFPLAETISPEERAENIRKYAEGTALDERRLRELLEREVGH